MNQGWKPFWGPCSRFPFPLSLNKQQRNAGGSLQGQLVWPGVREAWFGVSTQAELTTEEREKVRRQCPHTSLLNYQTKRLAVCITDIILRWGCSAWSQQVKGLVCCLYRSVIAYKRFCFSQTNNAVFLYFYFFMSQLILAHSCYLKINFSYSDFQLQVQPGN